MLEQPEPPATIGRIAIEERQALTASVRDGTVAAREAAFLLDLALTLGRMRNIEPVAEVVLRATKSLLTCESATLYQFQIKAGSGALVRADDASELALLPTQFKLPPLGFQRLMQGRVAAGVRGLAKGPVSYLAAPLFSEQNVSGALFALTRDAKRDFNDLDQARLRRIAVVAGLALQNAGASEVLTDEASLDFLTGLVNRGELTRMLTQQFALARRYGHALSVLMMDIDHFKRVNDSFGHDVGDAVLRGISAAVTAGVRESDTIGRYGGEELLMLLPETPVGFEQPDLSGAVLVAERIMTRVRAVKFPEMQGKGVTMSIGVAGYDPADPDPPKTADELVKRADGALYHSKDVKGRNAATLWVPGMVKVEKP